LSKKCQNHRTLTSSNFHITPFTLPNLQRHPVSFQTLNNNNWFRGTFSEPLQKGNWKGPLKNRAYKINTYRKATIYPMTLFYDA